MPTTRTTVVIIVLGLLLLGAAAYLFMNQGALSSPVTIDEAGPASSAEQAFLTLTAKIDPGVDLNTGILEDKRFKGLQDIRTDILDEAAGRIDPFAPLGSTR